MHIILKVLKNRDLSILLICQLISRLGTGMQSFALSLYVLKQTGSGTAFSLLLLASFIPSLILGPFLGVIADWFDRKKIIVILDFAAALITGCMLIISETISLQLQYIYAGVILLSIVSGLYIPSLKSIIPAIVKKKSLIEANSADSLAITIASLLSPVLGGFLFGFFSLSAILLANCISFLVAGFLEILINIPRKVVVHTEEISMISKFKSDFKAGIKFIFGKKNLSTMLLCSFIVNIFLTPVFSIGYTFICKNVLNVTDFEYGIAEAVLVGGPIIGPFLVGIFSKKIAVEHLFYNVLIISSVIMIGMSIFISQTFCSFFNNTHFVLILFVAAVIILSIALIIFNISFFTLLQSETPDEILGRVSAVVMTISMGAVPLGQLLFGIMFDVFEAYVPILISAIAIILLSVFYKSLSEYETHCANVGETPYP